jgi:hypothetical protein
MSGVGTALGGVELVAVELGGHGGSTGTGTLVATVGYGLADRLTDQPGRPEAGALVSTANNLGTALGTAATALVLDHVGVPVALLVVIAAAAATAVTALSSVRHAPRSPATSTADDAPTIRAVRTGSDTHRRVPSDACRRLVVLRRSTTEPGPRSPTRICGTYPGISSRSCSRARGAERSWRAGPCIAPAIGSGTSSSSCRD